MTGAGRHRPSGSPALRPALAPLLGILLLMAALPLPGPAAADADPSADPSVVPASSSPGNASPCPSPSASVSASPVPDPSGFPAPSAVSPALASPSPGPSASPAASALPDPCAPATSLLDLGRDGRLTVLLLGSDFRRTVGGERMDVILVMSLDPATKRVVAVSLPRDLVFVPQHRSNGGGDSGTVRINALYAIYRDPSLPHGKVDRAAMRAIQRDVETALRIEIDHWAMTRFKGFGKMIQRLGGIRVDNAETVRDPGFRGTGASFPASDRYRLNGLKRCTLPDPCRNPLIYVRSRKGTVGDAFNSDFARARRAPQVVLGAARRLVSGGFSRADLSAFEKASHGRIWTDMPRSVDLALELLALAEGAELRPMDSAVFGPRKWAYEDARTPQYTYRLRLRLVRDWMDERLGTLPPS